MNRRVVVIGAGMGGLTAALELAVAGFEVTLLERHARAGGKMREVEVGGKAVDSGPTVFTMRWVFEDLFAIAGEKLDERLELTAAELLARHFWPDGSRLDLYADLERSAAAIEEFANRQEADAYRRFAAQSADIFDTLDHAFMRRDKPGPVQLTASLGLGGLPRLYATRPFVTLWHALGKTFSDPRLRQLFGRYATYCGSSPFEAPATLMLIAHAERAGVWLVGGGMQRLAETVAGLAAEKGVTIRYGSDVSRIEPVAPRRFRIHTTNEDSIEADAVVFNGDVAALEAGLLGEELRRALPSRAKEKRSLSAITWSALADAGDFPLAHHTVFFGGDYRDEFASIFERGRITGEPTVYVCAQDRGPTEAAPGRGGEGDGRERLFLLVNAPPASLTAGDLDRAQDAAFSLLARQGLELSPERGDWHRHGPDDFARLFPGSGGAIYGWPTHGWFGSFRRAGAATAVPGLFCAGGTVHPGPGVPMTALSGRIAASRVRDYFGE